MAYSLGIFGLPGSGKSTIGLSHPGKLLHWVFGSSEETTQKNFLGRTDLETVKFNWMDVLKPESQAKFLAPPLVSTKFEEDEREKSLIAQVAKAKVIAHCWYLIRQLRKDRQAGKAQEYGTVLLDNATPLAQLFEDYIQVVQKHQVFDKSGELKGPAYGQIYQAELMDFFRDFCALTDVGLHAIFTCHVGMNLSEEEAAKVRFFDLADPKRALPPKEWQPLIMGKSRFRLASVPDYALFTEVETPPGLPTKFIARLEPSQSNIGIGKPRIQPFERPRELLFPKGRFYEVFSKAIETYQTTGKVVANPS